MSAERYRAWSKGKGGEARRAKKHEQALREEAADRERKKKTDGLKAYQRWVRLAAKER